MIKKNNQTIDKIYKGTTEIAKIYKGSTLVYENYRDIVATGNDIINITKAKANSLNYLKAFGKCEQRRLPVGYTELEYIKSTGTQYINTGINTGENIKLKYKFRYTALSSTSFTSPIAARVSNISNSISLGANLTSTFISFGNNAEKEVSNRLITDTDYTVIMDKTSTNINGTSFEYYTAQTTTFDKPLELVLFARNNNGSIQNNLNGRIYNCQILDNDILVRNFLPCRKNSDNVLGMYDTVTNTFYTNAGTGTFVAGADVAPTPDNPIPIWCNNGELKVRNSNIFDIDTMGNNTGVSLANTYGENKIWMTEGGSASVVIPIESSTTYYIYFQGTMQGNIFRAATTKRKLTSNDNTGNPYTPTALVRNPSGDSSMITITSGSEDNYLYVQSSNLYFNDNNKILFVGATTDPYTVYADGTQETIKDSLNNTATAENLLSVGNYEDVQEVISGAVTRKVGVKVLDGTENWSQQKGTLLSFWSILKSDIGTSNIVLPSNSTVMSCTHYEVSGVAIVDKIFIGEAYINFATRSTYATLDSWKQYLADQYNAGTPVIIVYPLETPTTEIATAQSMNIQKGTNIIEITEASLDNLEVEVKYKGK